MEAIFGDKEKNVEHTWIEAGINSIDYVKIIVSLEDEFDVEIEDDLLIYSANQKIKDFIDAVRSELE